MYTEEEQQYQLKRQCVFDNKETHRSLTAQDANPKSAQKQLEEVSYFFITTQNENPGL